MKWVDTRPEIDPLSGEAAADQRWFAASRADQAALESALSLGDQLLERRASGGDAGETREPFELTVVCAGPPESESMLRDALATGATRAARVDIDPTLDSADVAAAVSPVLADVDFVFCGNWSVDRGTGSFPAFLAHELGVAQALGCTDVGLVTQGSEAAGSAGLAGVVLEGERRLDGGRRERVRLTNRGVVSVEGGTDLRRAGLRAVLASADEPVHVLAGVRGAGSTRTEGAAARGRAQSSSSSSSAKHRVVASGPFRPRSRNLPIPDDPEPRIRLMTIAGALVERETSQAVHLDPSAAADQLLDRLSEWGVEADPEQASDHEPAGEPDHDR